MLFGYHQKTVNIEPLTPQAAWAHMIATELRPTPLPALLRIPPCRSSTIFFPPHTFIAMSPIENPTTASVQRKKATGKTVPCSTRVSRAQAAQKENIATPTPAGGRRKTALKKKTNGVDAGLVTPPRPGNDNDATLKSVVDRMGRLEGRCSIQQHGVPSTNPGL